MKNTDVIRPEFFLELLDKLEEMYNKAETCGEQNLVNAVLEVFSDSYEYREFD